MRLEQDENGRVWMVMPDGTRFSAGMGGTSPKKQAGSIPNKGAPMPMPDLAPHARGPAPMMPMGGVGGPASPMPSAYSTLGEKIVGAAQSGDPYAARMMEVQQSAFPETPPAASGPGLAKTLATGLLASIGGAMGGDMSLALGPYGTLPMAHRAANDPAQQQYDAEMARQALIDELKLLSARHQATMQEIEARGSENRATKSTPPAQAPARPRPVTTTPAAKPTTKAAPKDETQKPPKSSDLRNIQKELKGDDRDGGPLLDLQYAIDAAKKGQAVPWETVVAQATADIARLKRRYAHDPQLSEFIEGEIAAEIAPLIKQIEEIIKANEAATQAGRDMMTDRTVPFGSVESTQGQ